MTDRNVKWYNSSSIWMYSYCTVYHNAFVSQKQICGCRGAQISSVFMQVCLWQPQLYWLRHFKGSCFHTQWFCWRRMAVFDPWWLERTCSSIQSFVSLNPHQSFSDTVNIPWACPFHRIPFTQRANRRQEEGGRKCRRKNKDRWQPERDTERKWNFLNELYVEISLPPATVGLFGLDRIQEDIWMDYSQIQ